ncbi:MAG TPA: hypothetical protein VK875_05045 [Euzebyales bacterium]|nr:hypothetical protein [Euzebyales bacterium]
MAEPLIFVNTYQVKEGQLEAYRQATRGWFAWNESEHPRLVHHQVYAGEDGSEVTNIQLHPDSDSMALQMQLVADVHGRWQEFIDWSTMRIQLYGAPSDDLLTQLQQIAGSGVPVTIRSPVGGFTRVPAV